MKSSDFSKLGMRDSENFHNNKSLHYLTTIRFLHIFFPSFNSKLVNVFGLLLARVMCLAGTIGSATLASTSLFSFITPMCINMCCYTCFVHCYFVFFLTLLRLLHFFFVCQRSIRNNGFTIGIEYILPSPDPTCLITGL